MSLVPAPPPGAWVIIDSYRGWDIWYRSTYPPEYKGTNPQTAQESPIFNSYEELKAWIDRQYPNYLWLLGLLVVGILCC